MKVVRCPASAAYLCLVLDDVLEACAGIYNVYFRYPDVEAPTGLRFPRCCFSVAQKSTLPIFVAII